MKKERGHIFLKKERGNFEEGDGAHILKKERGHIFSRRRGGTILKKERGI